MLSNVQKMLVHANYGVEEIEMEMGEGEGDWMLVVEELERVGRLIRFIKHKMGLPVVDYLEVVTIMYSINNNKKIFRSSQTHETLTFTSKIKTILITLTLFNFVEHNHFHARLIAKLFSISFFITFATAISKSS